MRNTKIRICYSLAIVELAAATRQMSSRYYSRLRGTPSNTVDAVRSANPKGAKL